MATHDIIQCPHCGNDRMIELIVSTVLYDNYLCEVCSKIFSVKKPEVKDGSKK